MDDGYGREIGFYYLNSRYYNPQWGRFINADGYVSTGTGLLGYNMFAYCNNNPVMYVDPTGEFLWLLPIIAVAIGVVGVYALHCSLNMPTKEEHYNRNQHNIDPTEEEFKKITESFKSEKEIVDNGTGWKQQAKRQNEFHKNTNSEQGQDATNNIKFVKDKRYEVIICFADDGPYIVRDPNNVGTYNFGTNLISHFFYDMIPYWRYGNSPEDEAVRNHSFIYGW